MKFGSKLTLAALVFLPVGDLALAQVPRTAPRPQIMQGAGSIPSAANSQAAREWGRRLHKTDENLREGDWNRARRETGRLISEMLIAIEADGEAAGTLGLTLTFRALAEAGAGDVAAGSWDWLAAQTLQPDLNEVSLDPYGAAGKSLETYRRHDDGTLSLAAVRSIGAPEPAVGGDVSPPRKISGDPPRYPKALRATCGRGTARIAVTVDATGRPAHPRWLDASGGPLMALALFEAVRGWRYEPALRGGRAVPVDVEIEHPFDPGKCRPRTEKP